MKSAGHGVKFSVPFSKTEDSLLRFALVTDTDIVEGSLKTTDLPLDDLMTYIQESVDIWEGGLKASRGALFP